MFFSCCPEHQGDRSGFERHVLSILHRIEDRQMATQAELDALASGLSGVATELGNVDNEVQALKSANPDLDTTGVESAFAGLKAAADKLSSDAAPVINTPDPVPADPQSGDTGAAPVETPPADTAPVEIPAAPAPVDVAPVGGTAAPDPGDANTDAPQA